MSHAHGRIDGEDKDYVYAHLDAGQAADGIECPYCGMCFVVIGIDRASGGAKTIPMTGTTDYFCPCCGKNLRDYIKEHVIGAG